MRKRPDANQAEIVTYLRGHGIEVIDLSNVGIVPDLLCHYKFFTGFVEVKVPGPRAPKNSVVVFGQQCGPLVARAKRSISSGQTGPLKPDRQGT